MESNIQQARQSELLRRQEETLNKGQQRPSNRSYEPRYRRNRSSRSRSLNRRTSAPRRRSRSPEPRKPSFRATPSNSYRHDKLPACPICLGRHRHHTASCQASETWNGAKPICTRSASGRILNKQGTVICSDWQRPNRCTDKSGKHIHECSGCSSKEHGADSCPSAQA